MRPILVFTDAWDDGIVCAGEGYDCSIVMSESKGIASRSVRGAMFVICSIIVAEGFIGEVVLDGPALVVCSFGLLPASRSLRILSRSFSLSFATASTYPPISIATLFISFVRPKVNDRKESMPIDVHALRGSPGREDERDCWAFEEAKVIAGGNRGGGEGCSCVGMGGTYARDLRRCDDAGW